VFVLQMLGYFKISAWCGDHLTGRPQMDRSQKEEQVKEIAEIFDNSGSVVMAEFYVPNCVSRVRLSVLLKTVWRKLP